MADTRRRHASSSRWGNAHWGKSARFFISRRIFQFAFAYSFSHNTHLLPSHWLFEIFHDIVNTSCISVLCTVLGSRERRGGHWNTGGRYLIAYFLVRIYDEISRRHVTWCTEWECRGQLKSTWTRSRGPRSHILPPTSANASISSLRLRAVSRRLSVSCAVPQATAPPVTYLIRLFWHLDQCYGVSRRLPCLVRMHGCPA